MTSLLSSNKKKTREQVEEELRAPIRKMPSKVAESLFEDSGFQGVMNRWMLKTHVQWAVTLVIMFIGLNNAITWATATYSIPTWAVAITLTPAGAAYILYQALAYRQQKQQLPPGKSASS